MPARGPQQTPRSAPTGVSPAPSRAGGRWKWQTKFCQHPTPRMGTPEGTRPRSWGVCGGPGPHVWAAAPHRGDPLCSSQPRRGESGPHMQAQRPARGWPLTTQAAGLLSGSRARPHLIWKAAGTGVAGSDRRLPECTGAWNAGRAWLSPEVLGCSQLCWGGGAGRGGEGVVKRAICREVGPPGGSQGWIFAPDVALGPLTPHLVRAAPPSTQVSQGC